MSLSMLVQAVVAAAAILAGLGTAYLYAAQEQMIFPAPRVSPLPDLSPIGFAPAAIETPDGETLAAWWRPPPQPGAPVVIVFHGNGDIAGWQSRKAIAFRDAGFGVLLAEYRGYGGSTGSPGEAGLFTDGRAAFDFVRARTQGPVAIFGHSLGSAVAIHVAAERPAAAVVLEAPFASMRALVKERYPWLPVRLLLRHPFLSDRRIGQIEAPILMVHGLGDMVIGIDHARALHAAAPPGTVFREVPGAGHGDLSDFGLLQEAVAFIRAAVRQNAVPAD